MKKSNIVSFVLILFLNGLLIPGCLASQENQTIAQGVNQPEIEAITVHTLDAAATDGPRIVLIKGTHDFGDVGPGSKNVANYEFVNQGNKDLAISNVQSTCGCSEPILIKGGQRFTMPLEEPVSFEPGQTGKVEVTYTASTVKGPVTKDLYIISNDPSMPRALLQLKAATVLEVFVLPESVELRLDKENAGMPEIVVESTDGQAFTIRSAETSTSDGSISIPFDKTERAEKITLKPVVNTQKLSEFPTGAIQIQTTHPRSGTLLVRYNATPMYELSNPRYILQDIIPGEPILRDNLIRSNYGKKAEIESVTSRNGYMEIKSAEPEDNHLNLVIKITPPERESSSLRYITDEMTITMKDGSKLSIRSSGWFKAE